MGLDAMYGDQDVPRGGDMTNKRTHSLAERHDSRDVGLQLAGMERAMAGIVEDRDRLLTELAASRREAERLRMTLAKIRALLEAAKW